MERLQTQLSPSLLSATQFVKFLHSKRRGKGAIFSVFLSAGFTYSPLAPSSRVLRNRRGKWGVGIGIGEARPAGCLAPPWRRARHLPQPAGVWRPKTLPRVSAGTAAVGHPGPDGAACPIPAHLTSVRVVPGGWSPLSTKRSRLLFRTVKWALVIESLAEIGAVLLKRQSEVIARCVAKGLLDAEVDFGRYHGSVSEG